MQIWLRILINPLEVELMRNMKNKNVFCWLFRYPDTYPDFFWQPKNIDDKKCTQPEVNSFSFDGFTCVAMTLIVQPWTGQEFIP